MSCLMSFIECGYRIKIIAKLTLLLMILISKPDLCIHVGYSMRQTLFSVLVLMFISKINSKFHAVTSIGGLKVFSYGLNA